MSWRAWRPTISQICKELKRCRPDALQSTSKGFFSQVPHQIGNAHGIEVKYSNEVSNLNGIHWIVPFSVRTLASSSATQSSQQTKREKQGKDIAKQEDPFDPLTDQIPEQPVTFAEGASYGLVIFAGLGIAAAAAYAVFKELIFEPKEYKIFGKALERVQNDSQVKVRIGSPITGYGQESRNRAARQRIPNRTWTDEDGVERVEVNFYIRGPHGAGKVYSEMFKDKTDKKWKFTYLIVEVTSPTRTQLMLESYVPA
uniref:Mitochondrial import inner membrane translocase subunit Tim21 n=1 Tax=Araucaria cunninghamii TaxID=56994 RepID=A0A0D6QYG0_ARACU